MNTLLLTLLFLCLSFHIESSSIKIETLLADQSSVRGKTQEILLEENLNGGRILKLNNGTTWEVAPQDVPITEIWIFPFPIALEKSNNASYPYYLVNLRSKTKVLVRPLPTQEQKTKELSPPPQNPTLNPNSSPSEKTKKNNASPSEPSSNSVPEPMPLDH